MAAPLSHSKDYTLVVATRTASVLSVIGSGMIVSTFIYFPFFRKPINRLVFFATIGNILTNVATLMSVSTLPGYGNLPSGLCEFQGLLIQWFMVADSFWVLCMATNVFLVFFYGYDAQQLRYLEKWYFTFSYGIPGIPALAYIILGRTGHPIIGPATLWCWVAIDVDWMRIAFFYAPAWVVISAAITIYSITGYRILRKRAELHSVSRNSHQFATVRSSNAARESAVNPFPGPNNIVVTTQIKCDVHQQDAVSRSGSPDPDQSSISSFSSTRMLSKSNKEEEIALESLSRPSSTRKPTVRIDDVEAQHCPRHDEPGRNRYRATVIATTPLAEAPEMPTTLSTSRPVRRTAEGHAAAMAYFQVAFLMFLALFVVWLPSSVNRMYQFIHKDRPSFALNIISAIVLPLQGSWNAIIYIFTTRAECKRAWRMIVSKVTGKPAKHQLRHDSYRKETMTSSRDTRESTTDIALDEILKQGTQVRHVEVSSTEGPEQDRRHGKQASR